VLIICLRLKIKPPVNDVQRIQFFIILYNIKGLLRVGNHAGFFASSTQRLTLIMYLLLANLDEAKTNVTHDEVKYEHANQYEKFVP